jgi:hypothetical protein
MLASVPYAAGVNEDQITPGVLGFAVVVAMGVALFFLIRSMNKQISRIQAPKAADLKQAEWDRRQANAGPHGAPKAGEAGGDTAGTGDARNPATSSNGTSQD